MSAQRSVDPNSPIRLTRLKKHQEKMETMLNKETPRTLVIQSEKRRLDRIDERTECERDVFCNVGNRKQNMVEKDCGEKKINIIKKFKMGSSV